MRKEVTESLLSTIFLAIILMLPGFTSGLDAFQQSCIYLIVSLLLALYLFNQYNRIGAFSRSAQEPRWKNIAILSPAFIGVILLPFVIYDMVYAYTYYIYFSEVFSLANLFIEILSICAVVFIEEVIFRLSFQRRLRIQNRGLKILVSAGIFALFDIVLLFQGYDITVVLLQMIESFLFGAVLAMISEYGHCIYLCMGYHFAYKFIMEYTVFSETAAFAFILFAASFIYCIVIYFAYFKRKDDFYVQ